MKRQNLYHRINHVRRPCLSFIVKDQFYLGISIKIGWLGTKVPRWGAAPPPPGGERGVTLNFWQQQSISTWIGTTHAKFHQNRLIRYKGHPLGGQHPPPWGGAGGKFEFLTTAINFHMIQSVEYLHSYANGPQMYENIRRFFGNHTSNFSCLARHADISQNNSVRRRWDSSLNISPTTPIQ